MQHIGSQVRWFTTVIRFEPEVLPCGSCRVRLSNHLCICMRSETRLLDGEQTRLISVFVLRPNLSSLCLHSALMLLCSARGPPPYTERLTSVTRRHQSENSGHPVSLIERDSRKTNKHAIGNYRGRQNYSLILIYRAIN